MNNLSRYGFIISIIIFFLLSGCIENNENNNKPSKDTSYFEHVINIETNITGDYFLWAPIALEISSNNISEIMDKIIVQNGSAGLDIISTKYGLALNISSNHNITLRSFKDEDVPFVYLSMNDTINELSSDITNFSVWVFLWNDNPNLSINFDFYLYIWHDYENLGYNIYTSKILHNGWNIVDMNFSYSVS